MTALAMFLLEPYGCVCAACLALIAGIVIATVGATSPLDVTEARP